MDEILKSTQINTASVPASHKLPDVEVQKATSKKRNWRNVVVFCFIVVTVIGFAYWIMNREKDQTQLVQTAQSQIAIIPKTNKLTILKIAVDEATKSSSMITVPITIDTGENTVSAVELHISISPIQKQTFSIKPGTFFTNPTILSSHIDQTTGTAILIIGSFTPRKGAGTIGVISLSKPSITPNDIQINFGEKTRAAAIHEKESVIKELISGRISF